MMNHRIVKMGWLIAVLALIHSSVYAATVTASVLNVRRGPGYGYHVIATVRKGTHVHVVSRSGAWSKINSPRTGWCYSAYLAKTPHRTTTAPSSGSASTWKTWKAPPAKYHVIWFRGVKVNIRTLVMIQRAEAIMHMLRGPSRLSFSQGGYHRGVGASAGTHDGGGAIDVRCSYYSTSYADLKIVKALRMAGFAAWRRGYFDGLPPHIHCIAIGDRSASWSAKYQVREFFRGGDGLRGYRRDIHLYWFGHNIGRPLPNWAR